MHGFISLISNGHWASCLLSCHLPSDTHLCLFWVRQGRLNALGGAAAERERFFRRGPEHHKHQQIPNAQRGSTLMYLDVSGSIMKRTCHWLFVAGVSPSPKVRECFWMFFFGPLSVHVGLEFFWPVGDGLPG